MRDPLRTVIYIAAVFWGFGCTACTDGHEESGRSTGGSDSINHIGTDDWFVDVSAQAGLDVEHRNGMSGQYYQPEIMTPGVGFFDYDGDGDLDAYLNGEGNPVLGEQSIGYAIYAEFLPGDQPSSPSKRWLTDWKQLPGGFYFAKEDIMNIWESADASGVDNRLAFNTLKNGHRREDGIVTRKIYLPYIMYNSRGELSARGNPGEVRVGDFYLSLTEGGVLPPEKLSNGKYHLGNSERDDAANKKRVWLHINGITGRAGVLEDEPGNPLSYSLWVHTLRADPSYVADKMDGWLGANNLPLSDRTWAKAGMWGNRDDRGYRIFIGIPNGIRPVAIRGIPRAKLMGLIAHLQRVDPGIDVKYHRN